jgi:hypothetical protein
MNRTSNVQALCAFAVGLLAMITSSVSVWAAAGPFA